MSNPQKRERLHQVRTLPTEFRAAEEGQPPRIEGYFVVFDDTYDMGWGMTESIDPHAFDACLTDDVRCLTDHDTRLVLGRTTAGTLRLRVDEHGLWGSVDINTDDTDATNLYARVRRGDVSQCSFGFDILDEECENRADGTQHYTVKAVRLYEVSCCTFPAYQSTAISARSRERALADTKRRAARIWADSMKARLTKLWQ